MHLIAAFCQWLEQTTVGTVIRQSLWLFPVIETIHIFGIVVLVGSHVDSGLAPHGFDLS